MSPRRRGCVRRLAAAWLPWAAASCLLAAGAAEAAPGEAADATLSVSTMRRRLNDGTEIPVVGLGTWKSRDNEVSEAVRFALCDAGYRHIDAAQVYNNQVQVGRGIASAMQLCGLAREDIWVTSKIWMTDFHPDDMPAAVDRVLQELGLSYVDQLLLHWPTAFKRPPKGCPKDCPEEFAGTDMAERPRDAKGHYVNSDVPLSETWKALERAKEAGKVRSIGVSNFGPEEIDSLKSSPSSTVPAINQVEMHVFWHQPTLRQEMLGRGVALVAYSPLGNPALYGSDARGIGSKLITDMAQETGLTPGQVMLNFLVAQDIIVVPKSVTPSRIHSNIHFSLNLSRENVMKLLAEAPQARLANPPNRPGGVKVFNDDRVQEEL